MDQANTPQKSHVASGKERRAHVRYPVSVSLDIMIEGIGMRPGQARDFCGGGLLIAFSGQDPLPMDEDLSGKLSLITLHIDKDDYRLRARIAHADAESAGVSFINPDKIALQALQKHANVDAQPSIAKQDTSPPPQLINPSPAQNEQKTKLLALCNAEVKSRITPLLEFFFDKANDSLFNAAKSSDEISVQNKYFHSIETVNNNKSLILSSYTKYIIDRLAYNHTLQNDISDTEQSELAEKSLELISDEEFNVWLANSKVNHKIETEHAQLLGELERRLTFIYGEQVDRKNNPYAPCVFVQAFQHTMWLLELHNEVMPAYYDAFKLALLENAGILYKKLNKVLIENGVLPTLKDIIAETRKHEKHAQTKNAADDVSEEVENATDATAVPQQSIESREDNNKITSISNDGLKQHNLYELVGELRQLQSQLQHYTNSEPHASHPATYELTPEVSSRQSTPMLPAYSTAEAIEVMKNIRISPQQARGDGQSLVEFRNQLNTYLAKQQNSGEPKTLSIQQNQVIDVTENVFTSLLNDLQVAQSVRPWLEKLAIPVMKMALLDENIFTDKNHIVRHVINKLAELEVLASAEDAEEQAAVKQAFNWIINLVNTEFDGTTKVYNRAAQQLDLLIKVQQQSFERNLKEVVAEAIREEREQQSATSPPPGEETIQSNDDDWLRMVSRLKENHWVLFDAYSEQPIRLKVAWVAPRKGKFVFVNIMGRKDRICKNDELAALFKSGEAIVLDGTDDPAMDRAQYTMLQKLHKQLIHQSTHDELTGLINRREFMSCMQHALDDAIQSNSKHAICFLDIDNFQVINNNYGYDAGDKLLIQVAELIQSNLKENNVLSRIGSDHFALLLQAVSMDDAVELIEEIIADSQDYRFEWQKNSMSITLSAGIAMINGNTESMIDLLHSAESSCSMAKESGGNQIQIYHAGSSRSNRRKKETEWATKIDRALDGNELFLRCQKIIPIQAHLDKRPHYEVLLGISEELGGNSALGIFIQAAEHHNRMPAVDRWVIKNTFQWLSRNEDIVSDVSAFTINLSGQSLNNDSLIEFIYQQVNETSVPIERICFEITETSGVTNLSDAADFIQTIKGTGCQFALDDFGSGMSSYSYLKNLPVDYLKIDGAFIKDIANNQNDYAVTKSICEIGHFMEKTVIAEFVQDQASLKILRDIGVDYAQGYGVARPHALNDLLK